MSRTAIFLLAVTALVLSAADSYAQADPPAAMQVKPDDATAGTGSGDHQPRRDVTRPTENRSGSDGDNPPANPPEKDETVGVGGSVDRAPRDVREPFDE